MIATHGQMDENDVGGDKTISHSHKQSIINTVDKYIFIYILWFA